jgi:hypothetical protein
MSVCLRNIFTDRIIIMRTFIFMNNKHSWRQRNDKQWKILENSTTIINTILLEIQTHFVLLHIPHQCTDGLHSETGLVGTLWYPFSDSPHLCFHLNHQYSLPRHHMPMSQEYNAQYCYNGNLCLDTHVFLKREQINHFWILYCSKSKVFTDECT